MQKSLTVILPLRDAEACQLELERQAAALERGWAKVPGLISACMAILPADPGPEPTRPALLLECSFDADFADLMFVSYMTLGQELAAVLTHCVAYPESADARAFAEYVGARARRCSAFAAEPAPRGEFEPWRGAERVLDALSTFSVLPMAVNALSAEAIEARRLAVGMQEPVAGVPLVHVAWLRPNSRARVKRALRDLERQSPALAHDVRFLLDGTRLVFVAYPSENAQCWSERLSQLALAECTRIWRDSREFPRRLLARRARRERRLQEFLLEHRIPVAAWFNARAPVRGAQREN